MKPKVGRRIHLVMAAVWASQMVAVLVLMKLDWRVYLLEISLYANLVGHWSGWSAERPTEVAEP